MDTEGDAAVRPITVLLPPGVYSATAEVPDRSNMSNTTTTAAAAMSATPGSSAVLPSSSMDRFDKHRRLRRAMEAKEATLMELTRLLTQSMEPQQRVKGSELVNTERRSKKESHAETDKTVNTTSTPAPVLSAAEAELKYLRGENERLRVHEATRAKEQAKLETLVYDLRRELKSAGETLCDQTAAMKCVGQEVARMGPHRMIKTQRERQAKYASSENDGDKSRNVDPSEIQSLQAKVKSLSRSLTSEQKRREHFERRCAELQATSLRWKSTESRKTVKGDNEARGGAFFRDSGAADKRNDASDSDGATVEGNRVLRKGKVTGFLETPIDTNEDSAMGTIYSIQETYRTARCEWKCQEKEFKRYIQILESTIARMERSMSSGRLSTALLFNVTLKLVSCEGLLNRRNNGIGCIDPYVVLYSPIGEKVLETAPREDTDSPQFNEDEDVVTLKVAQGSPWYVLLYVYSRGVNDARLFLGQAKIPVELFLSDRVTLGKERRHVVKLCPRDREPDEEIVQSAHCLGQVVFKVASTVVNATHVSRVSRRAMPLTGRLISPNQDGEVVGLEGTLSEKLRSYTPVIPTRNNNITIRVVGAKDIFRRKTGINSNPFVIVYDLSGSRELLRTPVVVGTNNPLWDNSDQTSITLTTTRPHEGIIFRVYDFNRDGKDEFLGEARFSRAEMYSGKEWHELTLCPREDEVLTHIREHQNGLGKVLIQCVGENRENTSTHQNEELHSTQQPISKVFGTSESSKIVENEFGANCNSCTSHPLPIQIYVEACKGLRGLSGEEEVCVRIVAPNSGSFVTPLVSCTPTPSWSKAEGSTVLMLHPLQPGVIEFHVIESGNQGGENGQTLGHAQFSILDLFRGGFGTKELQLTAYLQAKDIPIRVTSPNIGSLVVSFFLLSSSSEQRASLRDKSLAVQHHMCVTTNDPSENTIKTRRKEGKRVSFETVEDTHEKMSPRLLQMRIYVKEGHNLLDCDQSMFSVLGLTNPRVMVWVGPDHVFTVPEKHNTVNPKWSQEEGEVFVSAQSTHIIRFEVQDVDIAGFDSMGCAVIHASEIIASPGEHNLPVMIDGKQYGTLDVLFTLNDSSVNES